MEKTEKINFALIGAAGYIAPRHMKAIKETNNTLVAALDKQDTVGYMDNFFPNADFFLETERFDRHLDKLRRQGDKKIEYITVCSPNYLHDSHMRLALRNDANVICEKPLVLNPWNVEALGIIEQETGQLEQQLQIVEQHISDMQKINSGLDEIAKSEDKEILANIGKGIYIPAQIKSKDLIVEIGSKNFVKKTIPETKKIIERIIKFSRNYIHLYMNIY